MQCWETADKGQTRVSFDCNCFSFHRFDDIWVYLSAVCVSFHLVHTAAGISAVGSGFNMRDCTQFVAARHHHHAPMITAAWYDASPGIQLQGKAKKRKTACTQKPCTSIPWPQDSVGCMTKAEHTDHSMQCWLWVVVDIQKSGTRPQVQCLERVGDPNSGGGRIHHMIQTTISGSLLGRACVYTAIR